LAQEVTIMLPGDVPLTLVKVPAGTFLMGSPEGERGNVFDNETQHEVTLTEDYYLGKTEITQAQWEAVMGTPMRMDCGDIAVGDDYPVYCVTWNRIAGPDGFMEKLNQQLGTTVFRLPTEAEWERAARAGTTTRFAHGDVLECSDECESCAAHDSYMSWCGNVSPFGPVLVGQKLENQFGLQDMHGNLWEIVNDRYASDLGSNPVTDPTGPGGSGDIVMRGGGAEAWINRSASRIGGSPDDRNQTNETGFRLAATTLDGLAFQINNGLNDAWFWPLTAGQGFFIIVWPEIESMFLSWFTFDVERPPEDVTAILGEPGHRWITALGPYTGDTATLDVYLTKGGVFDSEDPKPETGQDPIGTMEVQFSGCNEGLVSYDIPSLGLTSAGPIERITLDNVSLCESLQ
jgi:formylglycine-generating enzyme required for sulfatase activity